MVPPQGPVMIDGEETAEKERGTVPCTEPPSLKQESLRSHELNWVSRETAVNTGFDVRINFLLINALCLIKYLYAFKD